MNDKALSDDKADSSAWSGNANGLTALLEAAKDSVPVAVLRDHYLAAVVCDHEKKQDNPVCSCSKVHLGWHPSIMAAVEAWIQHVLAEARRTAPSAGRPAFTDDDLRGMWKAAGGFFHGPNVEHGAMPETNLLRFLRELAGRVPSHEEERKP